MNFITPKINKNGHCYSAGQHGAVCKGDRRAWLSCVLCPCLYPLESRLTIAPDKGQAAVVKDNLGSAPCG